MVRLFKRILNLLRGKVEAAVDATESPEDQLNLFMREMTAQVEKLQSTVAAAVVDEKRLRMKIEDTMAQADDWQRRAELALRQGDESLAKEALTRKEGCLERLPEMQKAWESQKQATTGLKAALQQTKDKADAARRQFNVMLARYRTAQAQKAMTTGLASAANGGVPGELMEKLEEKILKLEAETETVLELSQGDSARNIEDRFRRLERGERAEDALLRLKGEIGSQPKIAAGDTGKKHG